VKATTHCPQYYRVGRRWPGNISVKATSAEERREQAGGKGCGGICEGWLLGSLHSLLVLLTWHLALPLDDGRDRRFSDKDPLLLLLLRQALTT
jgi:hypothetical protein